MREIWGRSRCPPNGLALQKWVPPPSATPSTLREEPSAPSHRSSRQHNRGGPAGGRQQVTGTMPPPTFLLVLPLGADYEAWPKPVMTRGRRGLFRNSPHELGAGLGSTSPPQQFQQMTNTLPDRTHTYGVCPLWYSVLQPPHGAFPPAVSPKRPNTAAPVTPRGNLPYQSDIS